MSLSQVSFALPASTEALTTLVRQRTPRADARAEIVESLVPMRTCYETMARFVGPVDSVLDYVSSLFAGEDTQSTHPTPPLSIEEAHLSPNGGVLTMVLSRGSFTVK